MNPEPGPPPRLHPETAPVFRAAAGRAFTGEELDEICRVFPERAAAAATAAELGEAAAALGPPLAGAPSPRAFRAAFAAVGQAVVAGDLAALAPPRETWGDPEAAAIGAALLRRTGRAWAENALRRLEQAAAWTLDEWTEWMRGWFEARGWGRLEADFSAVHRVGVMEFTLQGPPVPFGWTLPLAAGALGAFGSRLSDARLEGALIGPGGPEALFLVTSPARAAEAGSLAAAGRTPGEIAAVLGRTKPLPAPDPAATGGAP